MAQLKDTLVQGSLRVTDTTYTEDLVIQGSKTKNWVLATPSSADGAPIFRGLDATDIPGLAASKITSGTLPITRGGTGTDDAPTKGGIIYASSTTAYASTGAGTSGQLLQSNAANAPSWITATNANTASTIVKRDASGNFSAGTITAALSGNASTATTLKTAREIYVDLGTTRDTNSKVTFNGSADKAIHVSGILNTEHGGTGVNSHTQNRLVWSNGAGTIQATDNHYASATKIAINSNSEPTENLYVDGTVKISNTVGASSAKGSSQLQICNTITDSAQTAIELRRGSLSGTTNGKASWQILNGATLVFRVDYKMVNGSATQSTTYNNEILKLRYNPNGIDVYGNGVFDESVTVKSGGIWVQGGSEAGGDDTRMGLTNGMPDKFPYNSSKRGTYIYSNAIAFADPLNGNSNNDAGWIRHIEETGNKGTLEIAVGDDNSNENIVVRRYNTSSTVGKEITLLDNSGNSNFPGIVTVSNNTDSTSTSTGAIVTSGGIGVTKSIKVGTQIKFTSTDAIKHIEFSRTGSPNYICYPSNGQLAIGFGTGLDNSIAVFDTNTALKPGKNNTYTLGQSSFRWKDFYTVNGNYSGTLTIVASGITTDDVSAKLKFNNTDTTTGITNNGGYIYYYNAHHTENNGGNMVIHAGGAIILGGGESPANLYTAIKGSSFTKENLYLTGDTHIFLEANANTIANRIGVVMEATGIYPVKAENGINATLELGHTSYNWKIVHSNQFISNNTMYIARKANSSIIFRNNATNKLRIDPSDNIRPETTNTLSLGTTDYYWNAAYITSVNANTLTATHASGGYGEFRVIYGTTIDYWWGVGTADVNHGMYDDIADTWIIKAGADNKWVFKGDLDGKLVTSRTLWGQNFDGSANVSGNMTNAGPQFKLPSGQTGFSFLTSGGGAATGMFYKIGLYGTYANADLTNYFLDVGGKARVNHTTAASATNLSSQLIIQSGTGTNAVALEFYRNSNASWQIINEAGALKFRNNYTDAVQTTYVNTGFSLMYNTHLATFYNTVTIENNNSSSDVGFIVNNNRTTNPHKVGFMVGGSGSAGIYDFTKSRWLIHTTNTSTDTNVHLNTTIMSGKLTLLANQYDGPDGNIGLDASNSDIIRVNGIYTSDKAELFSEGYLAYRSDTTWDAMAAKDGVFYFGSDVARDAALAGSATLEAGEIISRKDSGEGKLIATNGGNHKLYLYCNSDGRSGIYGYTTNGTGYSVFATAADATTSTFYGNVTGSSASCTGNSATATRINGNLAAATDNVLRNIVLGGNDGGGIGGDFKYGSGFYYNTSTKALTVPGPITAQYAGALSITINNSTQDHSIQLTSNASGTVGLYDVTKSKWMLYNTSSNGLVLGTIDGADITTSGYNMTTKCTTTDLKAANNGGSNEQRGFYVSDKNGNGSIRLINLAHTNGYNYMYLQVRAFNGNTDRGYQGLTIAALKNGTISTSLVGSFSNSGMIISSGGTSAIYHEVYNNYGDLYLYQHNSNNAGLYRNNYWNGSAKTASSGWLITTRTDGQVTSSFKIYGAVWNDYAEYRATEPTEPGRVVTETYDKLIITKERLMPGCRIVSDTFGFAIGQTELYDTPIAVSGRVLVYPYRSREEYSLGAAVCSATNGTVDIMTRDEIMMYPERIIGTVSEIPTYEIWQAGSKESPNPVQVNGRIWIYVR